MEVTFNKRVIVSSTKLHPNEPDNSKSIMHKLTEVSIQNPYYEEKIPLFS